VGGTRQRDFAGTNSKPHKLPENAPTPTSRVHLGMMAGYHFSRKNILPSKQGMRQKWLFFKKKADFSQFLGDVLRTLC